MSTPTWVTDFLNKDFESDSIMGTDAQAWLKDARQWLMSFGRHTGITEVLFIRGHFEWSGRVKLHNQWWVFVSGDCRYKISKSLLVRKCSGPKDSGTRNPNLWVDYNVPDFEWSLNQLLTVGSQ